MIDQMLQSVDALSLFEARSIVEPMLTRALRENISELSVNGVEPECSLDSQSQREGNRSEILAHNGSCCCYGKVSHTAALTLCRTFHRLVLHSSIHHHNNTTPPTQSHPTLLPSLLLAVTVHDSPHLPAASLRLTSCSRRRSLHPSSLSLWVSHAAVATSVG